MFSKKGKTILPAKKLAPRKTNEELINNILSSMEDIYNLKGSTLSFEELYRSGYTLVLNKQGAVLYKNIEKKIGDLITRKRHEIIDTNFVAFEEKLSVERGIEYLKRMKRLWNLHIMSVKMIRDVLVYLDRVYIKANKLQSIYEVGLSVFKRNVLLSKTKMLKGEREVIEVIAEVFAVLIEHERRGVVELNSTNMKGITEMIQEMSGGTIANMFDKQFSPKILEQSKKYYEEYSQKHTTNLTTLLEYLKDVEGSITKEQVRGDGYLTEGLKERVIEITINECIETKGKSILNKYTKEIHEYLQNNCTEELSLIYKVLKLEKSKSSVAQLIDIVRMHIISIPQKPGGPREGGVSSGKSKNEMLINEAIKWVDHVIDIYKKYTAIVEVGFEKNVQFQNAVYKAIVTVVNENNRAPEFIAVYIDYFIKRSLRETVEEKYLNQAITVFRFLNSKDKFEHYSCLYLSKRLLTITICDYEVWLINKLKQECGSHFTLKMEGMLKDIRVSNDFSIEFTEWLSRENTDQIPKKKNILDVKMLTHTNWPVDSSTFDGLKSVALPQELSPLSNRYQEFYLGKHSGRKLIWLYNQGTAELKLNYLKKGTYEVVVSTYQMLILMLFNNKTTLQLTYNQIKDQTGISSDIDLKRNLQSLACLKHKILLKSPDTSRTVLETDEFKLNLQFSAPVRKLRIPLIAASTADSSAASNGASVGLNSEFDESEVDNKLIEQRKYLIDAAIVRVMKHRKLLSHNSLIIEVTSILSARFLPDPALIKQRIDSLIDRDYIERSTQDRSVYLYIS